MSTTDTPQTPEEQQKLMDLLARHQDQQHRFLDSMEAIRWKFVTGFGAAAFLAIGFASNSRVNPQLASVLLIILSIASSIAQIRIYGLVHCCWERIRTLQLKESTLAQHLYGISEGEMRAFLVPHVSFEGKHLSHLITVHAACCLIFATFFGIGIELLKANTFENMGFPYLGISTSVALLIAVWLVSAWYSHLLNRSS